MRHPRISRQRLGKLKTQSRLYTRLYRPVNLIELLHMCGDKFFYKRKNNGRE